MAIAGLTQRFALQEIYESKVDDKPLEEDVDPDLAMLQALYKRETGYRLEKHGLLRHATKKFALADPGFAVIGANTTAPTRAGVLTPEGLAAAEKLVRFKRSTKTKAWGKPGGQMVPEDIYNELQWDMAITGKEEADVAVTFLGGGTAIYTLKFVEEIFDGYYAIAEHFMSSYCLPNHPPPTVEDIRAAVEQDRAERAKAKADAAGKP